MASQIVVHGLLWLLNGRPLVNINTVYHVSCSIETYIEPCRHVASSTGCQYGTSFRQPLQLSYERTVHQNPLFSTQYLLSP